MWHYRTRRSFGSSLMTASSRSDRERAPTRRRSARQPGGVLTRTDLRELGLERRAVDAAFRELPVVALPGYSRPLIRAVDFRRYIEQHTYSDDRVRPT